MAYTIPTIPAWLLPLLVLVGVCAIAGMGYAAEAFTATPARAAAPPTKAATPIMTADECQATYRSCLDANGSPTDCTLAYNTCIRAAQAQDIPVSVATDGEFKKRIAEIKKCNSEMPSPILPTPGELAAIAGGAEPGSVADVYKPHFEPVYPHEMPRQTEGFSIQQQVRAPGQ
jgi:hypothetical protein